ncbi:MAG: Gfo/Idh/MocA family oxidoreductase [Lachnospiraceae bacterium]|nr:Gfo/Idh/MocA family oxidoreductase [Lachnospiraceae bacterium]
MEHNLGVIGLGFMGSYHANNAGKVEGMHVRAVYDIREDRVQRGEEMGLLGYRTLDELLADEKIDVVVIATPNLYHPELAVKCLEAGKHVICEKPCTMTLAEFDIIATTAERCQKLFTVHQNRRWDQDYLQVKKAVEAGDLGEVHMFESRIHGKNGRFLEWRDNKELGGGIFLDWAPHLVDQILQIQQEKVVSVYAQMFKVVSNNVEDYAKLLLRFESGCGALIEAGTLCLCNGPRWVVHGNGGSMTIDGLAGKGQIIKDKAHLSDWNMDYIHTAQGPTRTMAPRPVETLEFMDLPSVEGKTDPLDFYRNLVEVLDGKAELIVQPAQVRRVMQIIDAAFESDRTGQSLQVSI